MPKLNKQDNSLKIKQNSQSAFNIIINSEACKINQCINLKPENYKNNRFQFDHIKSFKKPRPKLKSLRTNQEPVHSKSVALPQLVKPSVNQHEIFEFKTLQLDSSDLVLQHQQKNTKILNQMIDILRIGPLRVDEKSKRKLRQIKPFKQRIKSQEIYVNEFFENQASQRVSTGASAHRQPKIIANNQEFFKYCRKINKIPPKCINRNIFSEESCRINTRQTLKKNQSLQLDNKTQLLTFYTPAKDNIQNHSRSPLKKAHLNQFLID